MPILSDGEIRWLKTGETLSGSVPTPQHLSYLRRQIRAKAREMGRVLPLVFKHDDFQDAREEFEEAMSALKQGGEKPLRKMDIDSIPSDTNWKDVDGKFPPTSAASKSKSKRRRGAKEEE
jgi:hypothetical protein